MKIIVIVRKVLIMGLSKFKTYKEIVDFLQSEIDNINKLNECRLFREEQFQLSEEIMHFRNCIEWLIRSNMIISNIKYALNSCLCYATKMNTPIEETENKDMYAYYLEDSVYRVLVLWDMFRQLLNEYFKCGYTEHESISIFKFLREKGNLIGATRAREMSNYLTTQEHKNVREYLRNSFTHSVEATSTYIFHRKHNGLLKPDGNWLPKHQFENIYDVVMDTKKLLSFMGELVLELHDYRNKKFVLFNVITTMPCGLVINDNESWNLELLKDNFERIIIPCENPCDKANDYDAIQVCRPVNIYYCRINTSAGKLDGNLIPTKSFEDIQKEFSP